MQDTGDKTNLCHLCHNFFKCPIIVPCLFQNDPKNRIFVPYFLLEKSHISHIFFKMLRGQPAIKKSMLHANIRYMQKKIEAPSPKIQYSIMFQVPPKIRGEGVLKPCKLYTNTP